MDDTINLNVNSYSLPDLLQFAGIFDKNMGQITEKDIEDGTNAHIMNTIQKQQPKYTRFFQEVQATLLSYLRSTKKKEEIELSDEDEVNDSYKELFSQNNDAGWSNSYNQTIIPEEETYDNSKQHNVTVVDDIHEAVIQKKLPSSHTFAHVPLVQGKLNPNLKNTAKQILNIDSHYRKMIGPPSIPDLSDNCASLESVFKAPFPYPENPSDFTVNLSTKINKVINIKLQSVEIPISWYVFAPNYGTTSFRIGPTSASGELFYPIDMATTSLVTIPEGNYDALSLVTAVQTALPAGYTIALDSPTQKVTISESSGNPFSIFFYVERTPAIPANPAAGIPYDIPAVAGWTEDVAGLCQTRGPKVDYNLGWLLGFRRTHYVGESSYTGEAPVDTYGIRYIYIVLDDFKRNHLNQSIISSYTDKETFRRQKTSNSCIPPPNPPAPVIEHGANLGFCRLVQPPLDAERAATKLEWYAKQQMEIFWRSKTYTNRYRTWTGQDSIARIQIDLNKNAPVSGAQNRPKYILLNDEDKGIGNRSYFGPITLSRINIKLVNDKGYILDLNNMDWSCKFEIESIYQY